MNKNIYLLLSFFLWICACNTSSTANKGQYLKVSGKTMGTTYRVTYQSSGNFNYKAGIDSLLKEINQEVSTYIENSLISRINQSKEPILVTDTFSPSKGGHFFTNFEKAKEIYKISRGTFDPTVMPLVNYWGFGYTSKKPVNQTDSISIDSLIKWVGFEKVNRTDVGIVKSDPNIEIDFSAIAKGYGVDAVAELLEGKGVANYLVEIGGEVQAKGVNSRDTTWVIGINTPREGVAITDFQVLIQLSDIALATSGNYQNYYEVNGKKYSHTINPKTGFPERNLLLSASVFAEDCMTADGFATAMMVMGPDQAFELANSTEEIEAYLIFSKEDGSFGVKYTDKVKEWLQ